MFYVLVGMAVAGAAELHVGRRAGCQRGNAQVYTRARTNYGQMTGTASALVVSSLLQIVAQLCELWSSPSWDTALVTDDHQMVVPSVMLFRFLRRERRTRRGMTGGTLKGMSCVMNLGGTHP